MVRMMAKNNYWANRIAKEQKWQEQQLKNDVKFNQQLQEYYNQAIVQINKDIDNQIDSLARRDQVSYVEAQKAVSLTDIADYETEAKKVVQEANRLRAQRKHVTYNDFSDEVNKRMRNYNATMRVNRLEYIKSQIGLSMIEAGMNIDSDMQSKVADDYRGELKRQSGILNHSAENTSLWTSRGVAKQITKQVNGATFSQRVWANQDALKAQLDVVITNGILTGKNPRAVAKLLKNNVRKIVKNQSYVTERIARTESARVQHSAQIESIKKNGYQFVQWIAEPRACQECRRIATQDNGFGDGIYRINKVPKIPEDTHPNCRCSISETWVEGQRNMALTSDEQAALNNYISSDSYKINDDLRRNKISKNKKQFIKNLDAALAKMPIYHSSKPLQRDYFFDKQEALDDFISNFEIGGVFTDSSYISTSKIYYGQGKETIHVIIKSSKTGRDISEFNVNEQEVLFPRNSKFRIDDAYVDDNGKMTMVWSELDE
ncbi:ADP-ribosyltransferase [Limosilactobacillus reuteri]|uniref:ADP-ribosyltransferase n=2 Tax=Lactobacillaceae TaxID=33958 RepID=UPI001EE6EAEE|nr:ADP-ribosyltransferase [Limosilactobacillus reuteri]